MIYPTAGTRERTNRSDCDRQEKENYHARSETSGTGDHRQTVGFVPHPNLRGL